MELASKLLASLAVLEVTTPSGRLMAKHAFLQPFVDAAVQSEKKLDNLSILVKEKGHEGRTLYMVPKYRGADGNVPHQKGRKTWQNEPVQTTYSFIYVNGRWKSEETIPSDPSFGRITTAFDGKRFFSFAYKQTEALQRLGSGRVMRKMEVPYTPLSFGYEVEGQPFSRFLASSEFVSIKRSRQAGLGDVVDIDLKSTNNWHVRLAKNYQWFPILLRKSEAFGPYEDMTEYTVNRLKNVNGAFIPLQAKYSRLAHAGTSQMVDDSYQLNISAIKVNAPKTKFELSLPTGLKLYDFDDPNNLKAFRVDPKGIPVPVALMDGVIEHASKQVARDRNEAAGGLASLAAIGIGGFALVAVRKRRKKNTKGQE